MVSSKELHGAQRGISALQEDREAELRIVHISGYALSQHPGLIGVTSHDGHKMSPRNPDWEVVCWGNARTGAMGRIPMALLRARMIGASHVIWSTGSTRLPDGTYECEYMFNVTCDSFAALKRDFGHRFESRWLRSEEEFRSWMSQRALFDRRSTNTRSSMIGAANIVMTLAQRRSVSVEFVTSANHAPRVMRDASIAFGIGCMRTSKLIMPNVVVSTTAAETNYAQKSVEDVGVFDLGH